MGRRPRHVRVREQGGRGSTKNPHPRGLDSAVMPEGLPESPSRRTGPWSLAPPLPPAQVGGFLQRCQPLVSKDGVTLPTQMEMCLLYKFKANRKSVHELGLSLGSSSPPQCIGNFGVHPSRQLSADLNLYSYVNTRPLACLFVYKNNRAELPVYHQIQDERIAKPSLFC